MFSRNHQRPEWHDSDGDGLGDNADSAPRSACCITTRCVASSSQQCALLRGIWLEEGGLCQDCPPSCQGDFNNDQIVGVTDLLEAIANWGACP